MSAVAERVPGVLPPVHWAYVVGGEEHMYRRIQAKLQREGVNLAGHADSPREVHVPNKATVVLVLADMANHPATCTARDQADKKGIPWVMGSFKAWHLTRERLCEKGVLIPGAPVEKKDKKMIATLGEVLSPEKREDLERRVTGAAEEPAANDPTPPAIETAPAEPTAPAQPVVAAEGDDVPPKNNKQPTDRETAVSAVLKEYEGQILNTEVMKEVSSRTGLSVESGLVTALRKKLKLPIPKRGGKGIESQYKNGAQAKTAKPAKKAKVPVEIHDEADFVAQRQALLDLVAEYGPKLKLTAASFAWDDDGALKAKFNRRRVKIEEIEEEFDITPK
jgi:hypothetical protein